MSSARSMPPLPFGIGALALVVLLFYLAFNITNLPFLGGGTTYAAAFSEAAGLKAGNDVLVGGVKVGEVHEVELADTYVRVEFSVEDARVSEDPRLRIGIGTLLGNKYLDLEPAGPGEWDPDELIPLSRTTAPYDVVPALSDLGSTVAEIDTGQVAEAFRTLADTFRDTPPHLRAALDGVARLSQSVAGRDAALSELLAHTDAVTAVLADRRTQLVTLFGDGSLLLAELDARQQTIRELFVNTRDLSVQLAALVDENQAVVEPALQQLREVTAILAAHQADLQEFFHLLYPTTRNLVDTTGTGPWFDGILGGVPPVPEIAGLVPPVQGVPKTIGELLGIPSKAAS